jgi:ribonuclease J
MSSAVFNDGMKVRIHRGSAEIGGSCVEVAAGGSRLVLDVGLPLDAVVGSDVRLPDVAGFDGSYRDLAGVVISHGHPDHWGLVERIHPSVPVYIGEVTRDILAQAAFFTPLGAGLSPAGLLRDGEPMVIGAFTVTPHRVDHSAPDAYAIEVEAAGRRLVYSGDLRAHGRHGELMHQLPGRLGGPVDALLLEGTTIGRFAPGADMARTEADVEHRCGTLFAQANRMVLVAYSPQNVDRLISLYRASLASGRILVLDLYAVAVAAASGDPDAPRWDSDCVRVYVPQAQRVKVKNTGAFDRVREVAERRIYLDELAARAGELVLTFRASMGAELARAGCLDDAVAVWSMWSGYLSRPEGKQLLGWLRDRAIKLDVIHASGHAAVEDLQLLAAGIAAKVVVPVHTEKPEHFASLFDNVQRHNDGEWWPV